MVFLRPNYEKSCSESPCASISGLVTLNFLVKSFIQVIFAKRKIFSVIKLSRGKSDVHLHLLSHHCWGHFLIIDVLNEQCTSPQEEFKSSNVPPFFMRKWIACVFKFGFRTFWCLVIKWCGRNSEKIWCLVILVMDVKLPGGRRWGARRLRKLESQRTAGRPQSETDSHQVHTRRLVAPEHQCT